MTLRYSAWPLERNLLTLILPRRFGTESSGSCHSACADVAGKPPKTLSAIVVPVSLLGAVRRLAFADGSASR